MSSEAIAIIGLAGRFPQANNISEFWRNLLDAHECIEDIDKESVRGRVEDKWLDSKDYVFRSACFDHPGHFDAEFFGINAADAEMIDPQQRHFLEMCWSALENAGYPEPELHGLKTGVFGGCSMNSYFLNNIFNNQDYFDRDPVALIMANDKDFIATRVAYKLNLTGPAVTVQSACSTSLVAVHQACQALLAGECDMALAGGASVSAFGKIGYLYTPKGIRSKDGSCRPFDENCSGTVFGDGVGVVALKRLEDAQQDGDFIYAVIAGSAVNNDGSDKLGYSAPSVNGQSEVIRDAMEVAGVDAEQMHFVEGHGTGTELGDPIEVEALTDAFQSQQTNYCVLGSVKSNVGHLDCASGVTGLIKAALAVHHRIYPGTLHFQRANPLLKFEHSPFYVSAEPVDLSHESQIFGAVSSFGFGGTNAHIVLMSPPSHDHDVVKEESL